MPDLLKTTNEAINDIKKIDIQHSYQWLFYKFRGLDLWVWLALPLAFIASYCAAWSITTVLAFFIQRIKRRENFIQKYVLSVKRPFTLLLTAMVFNGVQNLLPINKTIESSLAMLNTFIYMVSIVWIVIILINNLLQRVSKTLIKQGKFSAAAIIPLLRKVVQAAIVILGILFLLQNWGFDIAAIIAALGVGGIALALASQKTVENLLGGVTLALDQPIKVGDVGNFDGIVGTVEDIGLRSTRIRTLDRTLITIPNAQLDSSKIESLSAREKMRFYKIIGLVYETSTDQIKFITCRIKEMLEQHEKVCKDTARVRFIHFNNSSLDIEIFTFVLTPDWNTYLEVQEDLLLRIKDIVEIEAKTGFAFPSQTLYMQRNLSNTQNENVFQHLKNTSQEQNKNETVRNSIVRKNLNEKN